MRNLAPTKKSKSLCEDQKLRSNATQLVISATVNQMVVDIESQPILCSKEVAGYDATRHKRSTSPSFNSSENLELSSVSLESLSNDSNESNNNFKNDYIGKFPLIHDVDLFSEFKAQQRGFFDIYECISPTIIIVIALFTRFNIYNSATNGIYFHLSLGCICCILVLYSTFVCMNLPRNKNFVKNSKSLRRFQLTWVGQNTEDILTVLGTLMGGFILFGRVFNGQCDSLNIWNSQTCNPMAAAGSIPTDQVILLYLSPVICQFCLRAVSIQAMFFSWVISVAFVFASVAHVGVWLELWTIMYSVLFLSIGFTYDKFARLIFLESKRTALIESSRRELLHQIYEAKRSSMQKAHELELVFIQTKDEKKLLDKEREALTALIGNVAHDLKTPLQSFVLDLELLKIRITKDYSRMSPGHSVDGDDDHPLNTLSSLNSACDFMRMAINRSIDFAKVNR